MSFISGLSSDTSISPIVSTSVGQWLSSLGLADYESLFTNYGFDDLEFIVSSTVVYARFTHRDSDLKEYT